MSISDYIFSKEERKLLPVAMTTYWILALCIPIYALWHYSHHQHILSVQVLLILFGLLAIVGIRPIRYIKYRYAIYDISHEAITVTIGNEVRVIRKHEEIEYDCLIYLHGRRYQNIPEKFIVIWKKGSPAPTDQISPYIALRKYDIILLPIRSDVIQVLGSQFGIHIPK